jgi:predicted acetyltransferase
MTSPSPKPGQPQNENSGYGLPANHQEQRTLADIWTQCFLSTAGTEQTYLNRVGPQNCRALRFQNKVAAGLATLPMGQWFGGRVVPMTGIASVGVAPEYRGMGLAIALMRQTLTELHQGGVALSALYPAAQRLYRQVGYELGGHYCLWKLAPGDIGLRDKPLAVYPIELSNAATLYPVYQHQAKLTNGYLERHPAIWQRVTQPKQDEAHLYAYCFGDTGQPQGYIVFWQEHSPTDNILHIRDWAVTTPAAIQTFWAFLASHRSQIEQVHWLDGAISTIASCLPEPVAKRQSALGWMVRIVDVVKALEARGYPPGLETELHLQVTDTLLPANRDRFILHIANGIGQVQRGGQGSLKLHISGLASLYTSLFTAQQLHLLGHIEVEEQVIAIANQVFGGPSPWMADFF